MTDKEILLALMRKERACKPAFDFLEGKEDLKALWREMLKAPYADDTLDYLCWLLMPHPDIPVGHANCLACYPEKMIPYIQEHFSYERVIAHIKVRLNGVV